MGHNTRAALLALLAFAIYATHDVIVKHLGGTYSPFQIVFFSVLFSFPLVTLMLIGDRSEENLRPRHPWWTLTRTVATTITGVCAFYAFATLPLAQTYSILFAAPMLITLLSIPILGEHVGIRRGLAVVAGLLGVLIVLRPGAEPLSLGHVAAMVAAATSALASIIVRKIGRDERDVVLLLFPLLANFVVTGAVMPFVYQPMPFSHLAMLAAMALMGSIAAALIISAYKTGEAVVVAPMQYSQILWATLFGLMLFDEATDAWTAIGAAVIIASGLYIVVREGRSRASRNTPVLRTRTRFDTGTWLRISPLLRRGERDD